MQLEPYVPGSAGDVIAPYHDGAVFTKDFWMTDRIGAMTGASVKDYEQIPFIIMGGGQKPLHMFVVGPDDPTKLPNEVMTSPGTPTEYGGPGWIEAGAWYRYDGEYTDQVNAAAWLRAGCPKENQYGRWNGYLPQNYVDDSWRYGRGLDRMRLRTYGPGRRR